MEGGNALTHFMTGNESSFEDGRPSTEPILIRGTHNERLALKKYTKTSYIGCNRFYAHENQQNLIYVKSTHDNYFSSVFGHHKKNRDLKKYF